MPGDGGGAVLLPRAVTGARPRLFWLALRRRFNVARGRVLVWPLAGLIYWPARGERLVIAPQELRTADPTRANEIYGGRVSVARENGVCDAPPPLVMGPPTPGWARMRSAFA